MMSKFDLEKWKALFPIGELRREEDWFDEGYVITSPFHLAVVEQLRADLCNVRDREKCVPTDVHVFGIGEASKRDATKIGGVPYRPRRRTWPADSAGTPYTFVAQFNFARSRDIIPDVPEDVLLVYTRDDLPPPSDYDKEAVYFEWYPLGLRDLIRETDVPEPSWTFVKCFGEAHRTVDFVDADAVPECRAPYLVSILHGTKIGGQPGLLQSNRAPDSAYLCSIGSIYPALERAYPWFNVADPVMLDVSDLRLPGDEWSLSWGDAGSLHFFIDERGQLSWLMDSL